MQLSRSFSLSIGLLALPLAVACGDDAGNSPTTPTASTTTVTPPGQPPVNPTTPPVNPTTPPVNPTTPPVNPTTPPVNPTTPAPVTPPPATDTWTAVYPIFQAKCDNSSCHGANEFQPMLIGDEATVKAAAEARVDKILVRTEPGYILPMPPESSGLVLTDAERASIQAWADTL